MRTDPRNPIAERSRARDLARRLTMAGLVALAASSIAPKLGAQVYVWVRTDRVGLVKSVGSAKGADESLAQVEKKEGQWKLLVVSDAAGHGAVFAVSDEGRNPAYFVSLGKASSREAITDAKIQASAEGKRRKSIPFIMASFRNSNTFPLKKPPKYTAIGVRG